MKLQYIKYKTKPNATKTLLYVKEMFGCNCVYVYVLIQIVYVYIYISFNIFSLFVYAGGRYKRNETIKCSHPHPYMLQLLTATISR